MSRPQGHRKSHSTSALNVIASHTTSTHSSNLNQSTATSRSRRTQGSTGLGSVVEDDSERDDRSHSHSHSTSHPHGDSKEGLEGLLGMISSRTPRKERHPERSKSSDAMGIDDLRAAIGDLRSLRSSERRRLAALRNIERIFVASCAGQSSITLSALLAVELHTSLISLLTRHAQTLSHRAAKTHTTLSSSDSVANALREELRAVLAILQGLCLVDRKAKSEMGQSWMLETIIDLLLVLRAQGAPEGEKPVVYLMLDLLCCILVDSPVHSRTFESLNGLEAVVRVLKGTGVAKEVRMKCIEFLYFYLLPEQSLPTQRNTSSSSSSTSSSTESALFPPTPVSEEVDALECPSTPSRRHRTPAAEKAYSDLDITFIPQTPHRPHQPSLGYLTPSTRRVSGSSSASLSVPPSPCGPPRSPSHRRLASVTDNSDSDNSGLGLGLPRSDTAKLISKESMQRDIPAIHLSDGELSNPFNTTTSHTTSTSSGSSTVVPGSRGISRSSTHSAMSSAAGGVSRTSSMRRISNPPSSSQIPADESAHSKERAPRARHSTSANLAAMASGSRSSEAARPPSGVPNSRSSIQLSDAVPPINDVRPSSSQHRVSRSGTSAQLSDMMNGPAGSSDPTARRASLHPSSVATPRSAERPMSRSSTSVHLGNFTAEPAPDSSRPPRPRQSFSHARTQSQVSTRTLSVDTSMGPPPSPNTSMAPPPSPNTSMPPPPSPNTSMPPPPVPKPTPRKGFPAGITKGLPSAVSSPNLNSPLTASKRIPSGRLAEKRSSSKLKEVKSVEEKKELLGMWLGNVDALVQGVEKVSFWGSVSKR